MPVSVNKGNVRGQSPPSSTDNAVTRWDGTTGRHVQDSNALLNDNGDLQLNVIYLTVISRRDCWESNCLSPSVCVLY